MLSTCTERCWLISTCEIGCARGTSANMYLVYYTQSYRYYLEVEPGPVARWGWHIDKNQYLDFGFRDKKDQGDYASVTWGSAWTDNYANVGIGFA